MSRLTVSLLAVAVAAAASLGAGCSDGDDISAEAPAAAGRQEARSTTATTGDDFDTQDPEFEEELRSFYDEFLFAADRHRTPDDSVLEYGSGLDALASPAVVEQFDAWRAANEALGDSFARVMAIQSAANITDIAADGGVVVITDCTLETGEMGNGQSIAHYVSQVVDVVNDDGFYTVTAVERRHEGDIGSPGYGCIPERLAEEAESAVQTMLDELGALQNDPRQGFPAALDAVVDGELEAELHASFEDQIAENVAVAPPSVSVEVLGLDPRGLGRVAAVSACLRYPDGLAARDLSSGAEREVFPPGTEHEAVYAVRLDETADAVVVSVIDEDLGTTC